MTELNHHAEPEAIVLLRAITEGTPAQAEAAKLSARCLLRSLRQTGRPTGRRCTKTNPAILRRIAKLAATGISGRAIGRRLALDHGTVLHHLKPSKAMRAACAEITKGKEDFLP